MKNISLLSILFLSVYGKTFSQDSEVKYFKQFDLEIVTNIRAIEVLNDSTVWFSGSGGVYGFTGDGGKTFVTDTLECDSLSSDLRSMAVLDDETILLMNAGSPAIIWKSDDIGVTWKKVFESDDPEIFFNALKFSDKKHGMAAGDPIRDCFQVLTTIDGGETWQPVACKLLPGSKGGEAGFAASNTSLEMIGNSVWFVTGGLHSRVFISADLGQHWKVEDMALASGSELTGAFTIDFFNSSYGIVAGGDYENKLSKILTAAITNDGGKTWKSIDEQDAPPFVSCLQFNPAGRGNMVVAACLTGIYISENGGQEWMKLENEYGNAIINPYYTFRFSPSGKTAWFAGAGGRLAKVDFR